MPSGFEAVSYTNGTEIVIAYAGTGPGLSDWDANSGLALGFGSEQLRQAALYYLEVKAANTINGVTPNITLTGHSLGGGLAALMGVMFDEQAVTFDQAPFANSASSGIRDDLVTYLNGKGYSNSQLTTLAPELLSYAGYGTRTTNVTGYFVQDEALQYVPFSTLGTQTQLAQSSTGLGLIDGPISLHSQALLSAFLLNDTFRTITFKLPELLKMVFDSTLYYNDPNKLINPARNFLEHLIRHQVGNAPGVATADAMLDRFTTDLQKVAQDGGFTLTNAHITNTLVAFAMQMYYENPEATVAGKVLFSDVSGGIRFDRTDVSATLSGAKGWQLYFQNYLNTLTLEEHRIVLQLLPACTDWFIQAGSVGMNATAAVSKAFMVGGIGADWMVGGLEADLLIGNAGDDTLKGGANNDTLIGGVGFDTYVVNAGDGFDTVLDSDGSGVIKFGTLEAKGSAGLDPTKWIHTAGSDTWTDTQNSITYSKSVVDGETRLTIRKGDSTILVRGWSEGELGIALGASTPSITPPVVGPDIYALVGVTAYGTETGDRMIGTGPDAGWNLFDARGGDDQIHVDGLVADPLALALAEDGVNDQIYSPSLVQNTAYGGAGNDLLLGGREFDRLYGGAGDDVIVGADGGDLLVGDGDSAAPDDGNDTIYGGDGDDAIFGGGGADLVFAGTGDDTVIGNAGNDVIIGGLGADILAGESIYETELGLPYEDYLEGGEGNDELRGMNGADILLGGAGDDLLVGDDVALVPELHGADYLDGGDGKDTLIGQGGADILYGGAGNDTLLGDSEETPVAYHGDDTLDGGSGDDILLGYGGDDTLRGGDGIDELQGGAGNDELDGGDGDDVLFGEAGNDVLAGAAGADYLAGGAGDDTYVFAKGAGVDYIVDYDTTVDNVDVVQFLDMASSEVAALERNGNDLVLRYGVADQFTVAGHFGVGYTIEQIKFNDGETWGLGTVSARVITNIVGTAGNDILTGSSWADRLDGGVGNDSLIGSDGNDTLIGGDGNDFLDGSAGNDILDGGAGNDRITSDAGDDTYLFGRGDGQDYITTSNYYGAIPHTSSIGELNILLFKAGVAPSDVWVTGGMYSGSVGLKIAGTPDQLDIVDFFNDANPVQQVKFADGTLWDISDLTSKYFAGTPGDDILRGTINSDTINGQNGNDVLQGMDGDDVIDGGSGDDRLFGGGGNDVFLFGKGDGMDSINRDYEASIGQNNVLQFKVGVAPSEIDVTAEGGRLILTIAGTNDQVEIGDFFDSTHSPIQQVRFADSTIWDIATIESKLITNRAPVLTTLLPDQEAPQGGIFTYTFGPNAFTDPDAGDTLAYSATLADGSALPSWLAFDGATRTFSGTPSMLGTISVRVTAKDIGNLTASDVFDITVNVQDLTLNGTSGVDTLNGGAGNDILNGLAGNDTLNGAAGNDRLDGGTGNDTLRGGTGDDTYIVDSATDVITENLNEGLDSVQASVTTTLAANVENLTLTGTTAINGTGNTLDNVLTGNSANNTLTGGAGNDRLDGGLGNDTLRGGTGNDIYVVNVSTDIVTENANEGTDTVESSVTLTLASNVENLTLTGTSAINGTGNALANVLTGNSANNTLSGGTGADTMIGGLGNDTYVVDNVADIVTENLNEGADLVQSSVTYTLADNVENLTLTGTTAINGTGNALDNVLTGNSANNILTGGAGNDTYVVNVATDIVTENANEGIDTIESSVTLTLGNNVENLTLTGTSALSGTGNTLDNVLIGNSGANTLTGNAGNDRLDGGSGNDTMRGGTGDDTYVVNVATDIVTENASEGTDTVESSVTLTLGNNVENLTLTGTSALNGTGNTLNNMLKGNSGVNSLSDAAGNDTLEGLGGADTLTGGAGNDTYVLGRGYAADTVVENDATAGNTDIAQFLTGVAADQIWFQKVGNNLETSIIGTSDKLVVKDWYLGNAYHVEQFKATDGAKTLLDSNVANLVNAMASFAPPAAGQTTLPSNYQTALAPVIAANWQ